MIVFDKDEIRNLLTLDDIYNLLDQWGGNPKFTNFGIISSTICHHMPGEGNMKLYYYSNSKLFQCYSNCDSFDIFQLVIKIANIQWNKNFNLNDAIRWIAQTFGFSGQSKTIDIDSNMDWKIFANYERIKEVNIKSNSLNLKEYDSNILKKFNYNIKIKPWLDEGISQETIKRNQIGYYPGGNQITIPHFDQNSRLIGIRGRTLCEEDGELYGKYRPLKINKTLYNHPLGFNLYNLNNSKNNIKIIQKAIVFEGEKSALKYASYFGQEGDISVASCGSSLSSFQVQTLLSLGVKEIIIGFDKQYKKLNTDESKQWIKKLTQLYNKYKNDVLITFLWDKENLLNYKDSPIDQTPEIFLY